MVKLEVSDSADSGWDDRISKSNLGGYQQTTHHANFLRKYQNHKPVFLFFKNNDNIVGQQLIFLRPRGTTFIKRKLSKFSKPYYFWKNSILIFDKNYQDEILELFTSFLKGKKFTGRDNPIADYYLDLPNSKIGTVILEIKETFEETISDRDPTSTQKHLAMAAHEGIATKKGVTAKQIENEEEIKIFYKMLIEHREHLGIKTIFDYESFYDRIMTLIKYKHGGTLIAYHNDLPISGITYFNYNGWIQNANVANTTYSLEKKLSSLDYLRCSLISIGVKTSAKFFDLGGFSLDPKSNKEDRISHSQRKWGGKIVKYNKYSNI